MATTPTPEEPRRSSAVGGMSTADLSRLPVPGNAELVVYLLVLLLIAIIWAASDLFDAPGFVTATVVLTVGYLLSRGIAKASRVRED